MSNRRVWRIKNTWPGSPHKGTIISDTMHEYYTFKPYENDHLFEELDLNLTCETVDGVTIFPGDSYYFIDTYSWKIKSCILTDPSCDIVQYYKIWSTEELAQNEINSLIELETEDGLIKGHNIPLWGCCISQSPFQLSESTSFSLWQKKMKKPKSIINTNWKWFKSEESRKEFMSSLELRWTKKDLRDILEKCGCLKDDITSSDINLLLNEIIQMSK